MCIAIVSTAHPDYSLIIIDNRDEFILRPTSRPHWWTHPESGQQVLSSRDLQRAEQGTWLAVNKVGDFAVLTNYREDSDDSASVCAAKSRGGMPTAWIGGLAKDGVTEGVQRLVKDSGVKGVGGFSMICGRLRKKPEKIAVVSNRAGHVDEVPLVGKERGKTWGLSNTTYLAPKTWPKISEASEQTEKAIRESIEGRTSETDFIESLFTVLDRDSMPRLPRHSTLGDYLPHFKRSVFVPPVGTAQQEIDFAASAAKGRISWEDAYGSQGSAIQRPADPNAGYATGLYGTQRQTVLLVDWQGNVTYVERALWDPNGNRLERGAEDVTVKFRIEGWDDETDGLARV